MVLNFTIRSTFCPCLTFLSDLVFVTVKTVFFFHIVLIKRLGGVKSILAKINLYNLLGCSIFRSLPALWEMQQAEPSFLCRIRNSVAFPVHMLQVRQNRELYLCLLYSNRKFSSAGHAYYFLISPATFEHRCWVNIACFRI